MTEKNFSHFGAHLTPPPDPPKIHHILKIEKMKFFKMTRLIYQSTRNLMLISKMYNLICCILLEIFQENYARHFEILNFFRFSICGEFLGGLAEGSNELQNGWNFFQSFFMTFLHLKLKISLFWHTLRHMQIFLCDINGSEVAVIPYHSDVIENLLRKICKSSKAQQ